MKKIISVVLVILMSFTMLTACSSSEEDVFVPEMDAVVEAVETAFGDTSTMAEMDANYIVNMMGVDVETSCDDFMVMLTNMGAVIDEYGVFKCKDETEAKAVAEALGTYIEMRIDTWMGYLPAELPKLENAEVITEGVYVIYTALAEDVQDNVQAAFAGAFSK